MTTEHVLSRTAFVIKLVFILVLSILFYQLWLWSCIITQVSIVQSCNMLYLNVHKSVEQWLQPLGISLIKCLIMHALNKYYTKALQKHSDMR